MDNIFDGLPNNESWGPTNEFRGDAPNSDGGFGSSSFDNASDGGVGSPQFGSALDGGVGSPQFGSALDGGLGGLGFGNASDSGLGSIGFGTAPDAGLGFGNASDSGLGGLGFGSASDSGLGGLGFGNAPDSGLSFGSASDSGLGSANFGSSQPLSGASAPFENSGFKQPEPADSEVVNAGEQKTKTNSDSSDNNSSDPVSFGFSCGGTCKADGGYDGSGAKYEYWRDKN